MSRARDRFTSGLKAASKRLFARAKDALLVDPDKQTGNAERVEAEELARSASELKGGLAKVAQLMGYLEGPGTAQDASARAALGALWDQAPGADPAAIRRVVEEDLGKPLHDAFATWSDTPLAAASLGEVHEASLASGEILAVKVQYPGVAEGLRDDLQSRSLLARLAGNEVGGSLSAEALATLRDAVLAELDYVAERKAMDRFAQRFRGDAQMVFPKSYPGHSGPRVLAAELLRGAPLLTFAAEASAEDRAAVALTIFRFAWGSPMLFGLLNADPNPGNYLVLDGAAGKVGFLDFGCSLELDEATVAADRRLWRSLVVEEPERFRHALVEEGLVDTARVFDASNYREWERHVAGPFRSEHGFHWTAAYARDFAQLTSELVRAGALKLPPASLLLWRQRLGVAAVLGSVGAHADYRGVLLALVRRARLMED